MSAEMAQKLVQGGIKAVRNGDHDLARKAFTQALKLDPNNEAAWLGMATITEGTTDKLRILKRVLEINPDNDRAKEAVRRLEAETESVQEDAAIPESDLTDELEPESDSPEHALISSEIQPIQNIPKGDTGELSDFPKPDWALDEDVAGVDDTPEAEEDSHKSSTSEHLLVMRSSEELFASMPPLPSRGQGGIPVPDREAVESRSQVVEAEVQAYLEASLVDYLTTDTTWTRKTRGRAGSGEYRTFLLQASVASFVGILVVSTLLIFILLNNPATRRLLLAPTIIPTATPTNTPTATPGVTNTASPTPQTPATETPALPVDADLGFDDPNFPPTPTEIYYPDSVIVERDLLDEALILMQAGEMDEARDLIDEAVNREQDSGAIPPTVRLSEWYLFDGESQEARQVLEDWQERWETASFFDNNESYLLLGLARVDIYEARNGAGDRFVLLDQAQDRLEASLGLTQGGNQIGAPDAVNTEGYLLLAEAFLLRSNVDGALEVIDDALLEEFSDRSLLEDTQLRLAKSRILADNRRYPEALQELYFALQFDPFLEEALILQAEIALESGQPGLGVLYAQEYLLYYPGSLRGFYLLGQAREAENKFDLALNAYSRAVAGDRTVDEYTSDPFFLNNLLARADLLVRQGSENEAAQDFSDALEFAEDNPALRVRRLQAEYATGNYDTVLADVEDLLGDSSVNQAEVLYYQGLSLIALADANQSGGNYGLAAEALTDALSRNLPSNLRTFAQENLAWAHFQQNSFADALLAINEALAANSTTYRIYLRGLILEGQGELEQALLDFEYIVTWGQYYNFPFFEDALENYQATLGRIGR